MIHQREDSSAACQDHQPEVHETMRVHVSHWIKVAVVIGLLLAFIPTGSAQQKLKAGFIYVGPVGDYGWTHRSEEHTSELQSLAYLVCRLLLEKKKNKRSSDPSRDPTQE